MAEYRDKNRALSDLQDLRAWRALLAEAYGRIRSLDSLAFLLTRSMDDALVSVGLGGSAWARERWSELRCALDEKIDVPDEWPELAA